jgi:hypothetical protein
MQATVDLPDPLFEKSATVAASREFLRVKLSK